MRAALASLAFGGEAPRVGLLGDTGCGKTTAALALCEAYLRTVPGLIVVIDAKGERRFDGLPGAVVRESPAHFAADKPPPGTRIVVFRASALSADVDPEEVAHFCTHLAARRWGSFTVNDELTQAARAGQWKRGSIWLPRAFVRGRSQGQAQLWATTSPHEVPREAFELSSEIWQFRTSGLALRLLDEREYLRGIDPEVIEGLAGYPLPPEQRGEFVRLVRGERWDGVIYKF